MGLQLSPVIAGGGGLSETEADLLYLRLDCTNDTNFGPSSGDDLTLTLPDVGSFVIDAATTTHSDNVVELSAVIDTASKNGTINYVVLGADVHEIAGITSAIQGLTAGGTLGNSMYAFQAMILPSANDTDMNYVAFRASYSSLVGVNTLTGLLIKEGYTQAIDAESGNWDAKFGAAENFTIDAAITDHTGTDGVVDVSIDAAADNVLGMRITFVSQGDYNGLTASVIDFTTGGMLNPGDMNIVRKVALTDNVNDVANSYFIGDLIISAGSTAGAAGWVGSMILFNTAYGGVDLQTTGGVTGYQGVIVATGGGNDVVGIRLEVENNTVAASELTGIKIDITPNIAGISDMIGAQIRNSGSQTADVGIRIMGAFTASISTDAENLILIPGNDHITQIGNGSTSHTLNTNNDLLVSGKLEANGTCYFDGAVYIGATTVFAGNIWYFTDTSNSSGMVAYESTDETKLFLGSDHGRQLVIMDAGVSLSHDFQHATPTDPTVYIHSATDPDSDATEWLSLAHDQTSGVISSGKGGVRFDTQTVYKPSSSEVLSAGDTLTVTNGVMEVAGNGGAVTLTSTPSIADSVEGTVVIIQGISDSAPLTFQDEGNLANSGLQLAGGVDATLGEGDTLILMYRSSLDKWVELSRSNN